MRVHKVTLENESNEKAKDSTLENIKDECRIAKSTTETENENRKEVF